jgi:hypothetical protein
VTVVSMSKQEFSRLEVLLQVQSGRLRVADACELIGLQRRQVFRLLRALEQDGATSLVSKRRWCASATPISARPWRPRSWPSITAVRCRARPCAGG